MDWKIFILLILLTTNVFLLIYGYRVYRMYFKEKVYRMTLENIIGHYKYINLSEVESNVVELATSKAFEQLKKEDKK